ncbi:hypothetical protein PFICI_03011 [Pestalotiopsis fici W106-1]|uniref:Uncharacterized protein n=1 Tax=Pestalotiopsis fici (strain W106-1 / CGMCC3.15140) TaxID=1229662 RepID=W3XIA5_PESFW|nr:uncharacterized protein PFICI_03011 [Pestalotiopsis fici W106-1]ETS84986.1 hypothetical protein PFICI_03011 [Pestalotiopsis fici W106-1]
MSQSEAPEWLPPEPGLEVVQPDTTEKIPVAPKRSVFERLFKHQKICGSRRRTFCWILPNGDDIVTSSDKHIEQQADADLDRDAVLSQCQWDHIHGSGDRD